jgi:ubiquitin-like modifier-activating enzyme ATG7
MFCLMRVNSASSSIKTAPLSSWQELITDLQQQPESAAAAGPDAHSAAQQQQQQGADELLLVMFDPCHLPLTPGWPLRNVLLLAAARWGVRQLRVLCVRDSSAGRAAAERSYVLQVSFVVLILCKTSCTVQLLLHGATNLDAATALMMQVFHCICRMWRL